ncbi:MAG TPA: ATP-binding protein, partial [Allosphingosinicella sp.]
IAHDFNNLLTGILSYSDLILQELRPDDPLRTDVEQIRDAGQRAAGLTRQLLAFSRRQLLNPRVVSLNLTVTELEPMLRRLLGPEITLETELEPELGHIVVDPGQIEQVLVNLMRNAADALAANPPWTERRLTIITRDLAEEGVVSFRIADNGPGVAPEMLDRLFKPFVTSKQHGLGMGLSICRIIVEAHGGTIDVESELGAGTSFTVRLPRPAGAAACHEIGAA